MRYSLGYRGETSVEPIPHAMDGLDQASGTAELRPEARNVHVHRARVVCGVALPHVPVEVDAERVRPGCRSNVTKSRRSMSVRATGRPCTDVRSPGRVSSVIGPAVIVVKVASFIPPKNPVEQPPRVLRR